MLQYFRAEMSIFSSCFPFTLNLVFYLLITSVSSYFQDGLRFHYADENKHEDSEKIRLSKAEAERHPFDSTTQDQYRSAQFYDYAEESPIAVEEAVCTGKKLSHIHKAIKNVECSQPQLKIVKLKSPGPNFAIVPSVAKVRRCAGHCLNPRICLPSKVFKIDQTDRNEKQTTCVDFYLEQHDECTCQCSILAKHCSNKQYYNEVTCACACREQDEKEMCFELADLERNRFWDEASCSCQMLD